MHYVTIPSDFKRTVRLATQSGPKNQEVVVAFRDCVDSWLDDKRWGRSQRSLKLAGRIDRKMDGLKAGDVLALEDDEWAALCEVVSDMPEGSEYTPAIMRHAVYMLDAVTEAPTDNPADKKNGEARAPART